MKEIIVKYGINTVIKDTLNVSFPFIRAALRGQRDTEIAMKIREKALELGGVEVPEKK